MSVSSARATKVGTIQVDRFKISMNLEEEEVWKINGNTCNFKVTRDAQFIFSADDSRVNGEMQRTSTLLPSSDELCGNFTHSSQPQSQKFLLERSSSMPSIFGNWGGVWRVEDGGLICELTISGSSFSVHCPENYGDYHLSGSGANNTLSAQDTFGLQFAAQRR